MPNPTPLKQKFRLWLKLMKGANSALTARQLAHALGVPEETVYRLAPKKKDGTPRKPRRPGRFDADALDKMSAAIGMPAWAIVQLIETGRTCDLPKPPPRASRKKVLTAVTIST